MGFVGISHIQALVWPNSAIEITVEHDAEWEECGNAVLNRVLSILVDLPVKGS